MAGPHIEKLFDHGPLGKGLDRLLNTQRLEQALDLMKNDPALPFGDALQQADVDLSNVPTALLRDIVQSQPAQVQQQIAQWANGSGDLPGGANRLGLGDSMSGSPAPAASSIANNSVGPAGLAPGQAYGRTADAPPVDLGTRLTGSTQAVQTLANAPSQLIQRVFNGEAVRMEPQPNQIAPPGRAAGETMRTDAPQMIAMPRNVPGEGQRIQHMNPQILPNTASSQAAQLPATAPPAALQRADVPAAAQGASQTSSFAGAPLANPQGVPVALGKPLEQQALPPQLQTPLQATLAQPRPDASAAQLQAQGQTQLMAMPQARPDALPAQVIPQLAGMTLLANPQAPPVLNPHAGQNAVPGAPGADNAATQVRNTLLAPAGHTLAGFLRRDHRGEHKLRERTMDWVLALMPGRRKRVDGEPEATSFHWLFWLLTIIAYGALTIAASVMVASGGRVVDASGAPTLGVYALLAGGAAALASCYVGRRLSRK